MTSMVASGPNGSTPCDILRGMVLRARVVTAALGAILCVLTATAAAKTQQARRIDPDKRYQVPTDGAQYLGPRNAKVTIVAFTDLECAHCAKAHTELRRLMTKYKGDVRVVIRHFPGQDHPSAELGARMALAAGVQQKLALFLREVFARQPRGLSADALMDAARAAKVDVKQLAVDKGRTEVIAMLARDYAMGLRFGVHGTPTFFVNGVPLEGAKGLAEVVQREMSAATALVAGGMDVSEVYAQRLKGGMEEAAFMPTGEPDIEPIDGRRWQVAVESAPERGNLDAPVVLIEFGDFQCPFCAAANALVERLREAFPEEVRVVWRNFPLAVHSDAAIAAEAGMAAHAQGKFWAMHDAMFRERVRLDRKVLSRIAQEIGLDVLRFNKDLEKHKFLPKIEADLKLVTGELGGTGTPTFFINGRRIKGAQRFEKMVGIIKEEIKRANAVRKGAGKGQVYDTVSRGDDELEADQEVIEGEAALKAGRLDDAETHALNALGLAPDRPAALELMVKIKCQAKDTKAAREAARRLRDASAAKKMCAAAGVTL